MHVTLLRPLQTVHATSWGPIIEHFIVYRKEFDKTGWSCPWNRDQNCSQNSARGGGVKRWGSWGGGIGGSRGCGGGQGGGRSWGGGGPRGVGDLGVVRI